MIEESNVYRIRTDVGETAPNVVHVQLNQTYDMFEILSLKIKQEGVYKKYVDKSGIIVGRVIINGGVGVPNAKVSIFIEVSDDETDRNKLLYNFLSTRDLDNDGVRYNLLPDEVDDSCHQNVGTFPNKRLLLDNNDVIEVFDRYWKYTTTTNNSGDYMLTGIPTGSQQLHCDVDLSDCGFLSQRPRDLVDKGYNVNMFDSPNKFKTSKNLNSLPQIISQDKSIFVHPYWGDVSDGTEDFAITRCDIEISYKFEPTAIFMGSIVTDSGSNAIGKNCATTEKCGKMSELIAGEGTIEMIRKTIDGKIEEYSINGNKNIDSDGTFVMAIPMNLDYVTTDEFGSLIPTDNPKKGIPTRARVRFRVSVNENPNDASARKRGKYLIPNNPRIGDKGFTESLSVDYEFGSSTRDESFCDLFWNKVYTVKNYIPKLQKDNKVTNRKHTGIKLINEYGDNNPMPYNSLNMQLSFSYRFICVIVKVFIDLVGFINNVISSIGGILCLIGNFKLLGGRPFKFLLALIPTCIELSSDFCDDGVNPNIYYPGCGKPIGCVWEKMTRPACQRAQSRLPKEEQKVCINSTAQLRNCVETQLARQNDAASFDFNNDWINGVLYAPLWYRKISPKKSYFFGLFSRRAKDEWCSVDKNTDGLRVLQACAVERGVSDGKSYKNYDDEKVTPHIMGYDPKCNNNCHKKIQTLNAHHGVIKNKETILGQTVYYYNPIEFDKNLKRNTLLGKKSGIVDGEIKLLFATDIVLLGSLNENDANGIPQFFKSLESTTYDLPTDVLFTDYEIKNEFDHKGNYVETKYVFNSEMAGRDWGNRNEYGVYDGGLFYDIGCSTIKLKPKSCINLSRLCEFGVSLDETKEVPNLQRLEHDGDNAFQKLITDGFISFDELYNLDERSMFATMNGNNLKTRLNSKNGLLEYDFHYLYPENFDGSLYGVMKNTTSKYGSEVTYRNNYKLEQFSRDYYAFRMGNTPYFYDDNGKFPRYENSYYFYFGLKAGKTALDKFFTKYFSDCGSIVGPQSPIGVKTKSNTWCGEVSGGKEGLDGFIALDFSRVNAPFDLTINGGPKGDYSKTYEEINNDKIFIYGKALAKEIVGKYICNSCDYSELKGSEMLENGIYDCVITDANGDISDFRIELGVNHLDFNTLSYDFKQPNNVLLEKYKGNYSDIAKQMPESNQDVRDIGGVIFISNIVNDNEDVKHYKIRVSTEEKISGYQGIEFTDNTKSSDLSQIGVLKVGKGYYIGVPKGDVVYDVTITEICGVLDTRNVTNKRVLVKDALAYKLFINDIDYELIKKFNETGWLIANGVTINNAPNNKNYDKVKPKDDGNILVRENPWFNVHKVWGEKSKFYNVERIKRIEYFEGEEGNSDLQTKISNFVRGIYQTAWNNNPYKFTAETNEVDDNGKNKTKEITLTEILKEFTQETVHGTPYSWCGDYILKNYNVNSFNQNSVGYTISNINVLVSELNNIIDKVNKIIVLRNELPNMMYSVFYLMSYDDSKHINLRIQSADLPATPTVLYQPEIALEGEEVENGLLNENLTLTHDFDIDNITIPTITYACNRKYGVKDSKEFYPVVSQYKNLRGRYFRRHAYYVGVANNEKNTIPSKLGVTEDARYKLKRISTDTELRKLFAFPIIDKSVTLNYVVWSAFSDIPFYRKKVGGNKYELGIINMNGIFASDVYNGILVNNKFATQNIGNYQLKLSKNLVSDKDSYVEKRIILGLENEENLQDLFSFKEYIVDENLEGSDKMQYAPLLPNARQVILQDENGHGISLDISPNMKIKLKDTAINDGLNGSKILSVTAENSKGEVYFTIIREDKDEHVLNYPLNSVTRDAEGNFVMTNRIFDYYNKKQGHNSSYNIFSQKMGVEFFRNSNGNENFIGDTKFASVVNVYDENGNRIEKTSFGYGIDGNFSGGNITYPVYIVAESEDGCRAISPIYDFQDAFMEIIFGDAEEYVVDKREENGSVTYSVTKKVTHKIGASIFEGNFYLEYYPYYFGGLLVVDSQKYELPEIAVSGLHSSNFIDLDEAHYNNVKHFFNSTTYVDYTTNGYHKNNRVIATDITGLRHVCSVKNLPNLIESKKLYGITWVVAAPDNAIYDVGIDFGGSLKQIHTDYYNNQTNQQTMVFRRPKETQKWVFLGWSEDGPTKDSTKYFNDWNKVKNLLPLNSPKVFYGNWRKYELYDVNFSTYNENGVLELLETMRIENDTKLSLPFKLQGKTWYMSDDRNKQEVDFNTLIIDRDMNFIAHRIVDVTYEDQETIAITFNVEANDGYWWEDDI